MFYDRNKTNVCMLFTEFDIQFFIKHMMAIWNLKKSNGLSRLVYLDEITVCSESSFEKLLSAVFDDMHFIKLAYDLHTFQSVE